MEAFLISKLEFENVDQKKRKKTVRVVAQVKTKPWTRARSRLTTLPFSPSHEPPIPLESGRAGSLETKQHNFFFFFLWYPDMGKESGHSFFASVHACAGHIHWFSFDMCSFVYFRSREEGRRQSQPEARSSGLLQCFKTACPWLWGILLVLIFGPSSSKERLFDSCNI